MKNSYSKIEAEIFSQFIEQSEIKNIVISPGSRNAPLIHSFTNKNLNCISILDERSAGFIGLGLALESNLPSLLCCTSGTAVLNYAPAIAEAYYQKIPLLICTADRPLHQIDQGVGQTIRQNSIYKNYCDYSFTINGQNENELQDIFQKALNILFQEPKGPIHINFHFDEPLYEFKTDEIHVIFKKQPFSFKQNSIKNLTDDYSKSNCPLIIVGQINKPGNKIIQSLNNLSKNGVLVFAENLSNIAGNKIHFNGDYFTKYLIENDIKPDLIISLGNPIVSKKLRLHLSSLQIQKSYLVQSHIEYRDSFQSNNTPIKFKIENLLLELDSISKKVEIPNFQLNNPEIIWSDIYVLQTVLKLLPKNVNLHLANSSSIRYSQFFKTKSTTTYFSNRGTSGIDGSTSTALGISISNPNKLNVLITGDLSFFYDSNAFLNNILINNLIIIVLNNSGGNIFKSISGPKNINHFEKYIISKQSIEIEKMCIAFNINYRYANSEKLLKKQLLELFHKGRNRISLLEVKTISEINSQQYKAFTNQ